MVTLDQITPAPQDVADLIPRLVPDADGTETGSFSTTTNPTAAAVQRLADRAAAWVLAAFPRLTEQHAVVAKDVAALVTAARVARPLDESEYDRLRQELEQDLASLRLIVADAADGTVDGLAGSPLHSFPDVDALAVAEFAERPYWPYA
jgi:predicted ATPase